MIPILLLQHEVLWCLPWWLVLIHISTLGWYHRLDVVIKCRLYLSFLAKLGVHVSLRFIELRIHSYLWQSESWFISVRFQGFHSYSRFFIRSLSNQSIHGCKITAQLDPGLVFDRDSWHHTKLVLCIVRTADRRLHGVVKNRCSPMSGGRLLIIRRGILILLNCLFLIESVETKRHLMTINTRQFDLLL